MKWNEYEIGSASEKTLLDNSQQDILLMINDHVSYSTNLMISIEVLISGEQ